MTPCIAIDRDFTVGVSPSLAELHNLSRCGFRSVVDLRDDDEASAQTISNAFEVLRFCHCHFLHIPVPKRAVPGELLDEFRREVQALPKPVYVHSTQGARAAVFTVLHLGLEVGATDEDVVSRLRRIGFFGKLAAQEEAIRAYVRAAREPYKRLEQVIW